MPNSSQNFIIIASVISSDGEVLPGPYKDTIAKVEQEPDTGNTIIYFRQKFQQPPVVVAKQYGPQSNDLSSKGTNTRSNVSVVALTNDTIKFKTGDGKGGSVLRDFAFTAVGNLVTEKANNDQAQFIANGASFLAAGSYSDESEQPRYFDAIALVSETILVKKWQVQVVAAALYQQIKRDFAPIWGYDAVVHAFDAIEDVPKGYWPIIIRDDIGLYGGIGVHLDKNDKPFGLVQATNRWSITASHEILEMLADPLGNRYHRAESIIPGQGLVDYLVEVCDPCQADEFAYQRNGVWVSDFYTPDYFSDEPASSRRQYSFTNNIRAPKSVLFGGNLSWLDPQTDCCWQQAWIDGAEPEIINLGRLQVGYDDTVKSLIDAMVLRQRGETATSIVGLPEDHPMIVEQQQVFKTINEENRQRANEWSERVKQLAAK